jgi:hypothetical protein
MPLDNRMTMTEMVAELYRMCGNLAILSSAAGGPIERAINDALFSIGLKYRHHEFESKPPYHFQSVAVTGTVTVGAQNASSFTTAALTFTPSTPPITDFSRLIGAPIGFGTSPFDGTMSGQSPVIWDITPTSGVGPYTISISPQLGATVTGQPFTAVLNRYPMPTQPLTDNTQTSLKVFFVYDVSCISRRTPLKEVDVRVFDRSVPLAGLGTYYARVNDELYIYPAPTTGSATMPDTFRVRYALRPIYRTGSSIAIDPLPEEWQRIVIMEAFAMILDDQREHERAEATRGAATRLATELMKPPIEEVEDYDAALTPRLYYQ